MVIFISTLILAEIAILILNLFYRKRKEYKKQMNKDLENEKEESTDYLLDKYVEEDLKEEMKEKLDKVAEIVAETESLIENAVTTKVKVAEEHMKTKRKEKKKIVKAGLRYDTITSSFQSAMPETEEARIRDMKELKSTLAMLEALDNISYKDTKRFDAGRGIFFEKMSRKFKSIITELKLDNYILIPIQRLKFHIFLNVKTIKDEDILPILIVMMETKMIKDIVEINPTFHVIVFHEEGLKFSLPEKVLLSFTYDCEKDLTIQKLMELTEWKKEYTEKIIKSLTEKGILTIFGNKIIVGGFGQPKNKKIWNNSIIESIQKEKEKVIQKEKRQLVRKEQLKKQLSKVESSLTPQPSMRIPLGDFDDKELDGTKTDEKTFDGEEIYDSIDNISAVDKESPKIKFQGKPKVQNLPQKETKVKEKQDITDKKLKEKQDFDDKVSLLKAMDALDEIMPAKINIEKINLTEEPDLEDLVPEKILSYHEKFSLINGGLIQYAKIKKYVIHEIGDVPYESMKITLNQLIELQMIHGKIQIENIEFYLFNEITLGEDEKKFLNYALHKKPLNKDDYINGLKWEEEKILFTMKSLQEKGILRIEKDKIVIPGIIQEEE